MTYLAETDPGTALAPDHSTSARISWAQLLKRVFDIDIELCPHCGGTLKIIAATEDPSVITRILAHLGSPTRAPRNDGGASVYLSCSERADSPSLL